MKLAIHFESLYSWFKDLLYTYDHGGFYAQFEWESGDWNNLGREDELFSSEPVTLITVSFCAVCLCVLSLVEIGQDSCVKF